VTGQNPALKFYTDTHISKQVAVQLRNHSIDVIRCEEVGLAEASDEKHLEYASAEKRVLLTKDDDFAKLHVQWQDKNREHAGIFYCIYRDKSATGLIVSFCLEISEYVKAGAATINEDIANQIIYIT